jgi:hypothetical protein
MTGQDALSFLREMLPHSQLPQCDADGNPRYSISRLVDIGPLVNANPELSDDERAVYEALSRPSHDIDTTLVKQLTIKKLAQKLGWKIQQTDTAAGSLVEHRIKPYL